MFVLNALLELSDALKSINDLIEGYFMDELEIFAEEIVRFLESYEHIFVGENET